MNLGEGRVRWAVDVGGLEQLEPAAAEEMAELWDREGVGAPGDSVGQGGEVRWPWPGWMSGWGQPVGDPRRQQASREELDLDVEELELERLWEEGVREGEVRRTGKETGEGDGTEAVARPTAEAPPLLLASRDEVNDDRWGRAAKRKGRGALARLTEEMQRKKGRQREGEMEPD